MLLFKAHSNCNRVGILVCKWLFQLIHDTNAVSAFDCILPLMVCDTSLTPSNITNILVFLVLAGADSFHGRSVRSYALSIVLTA